MTKRFVTFLILGVILVGAAEWELHDRRFKPIRVLDRFWVDFCIGNAGKKVGNPSITMVRITDEYEPVPIGTGASSSGTPGSKALTRLDFAAFLFAIGKLNPKAVSFIPSPVFEEKSVLNQTDIFPLKDAALQLPRVTLGTVVSGEGTPANSAEACNYTPVKVNGDPASLPAIERTVRPADPELLANGDPAFFVIETANPLVSGNPRIQLVARQGSQVVPGFVLASVARQKGLSMDSITVNLEGEKPSIRVGERYTIPIAKDGTMELPSHGGLSHSMYESVTGEDGKEKRVYQFASLKVEDVALAVERSDEIAQSIFAEFSGKFDSIANNLVLLGFDRISDREIETANDERLSPMTATARAIATIQSGRHTTRWPLWIRGIAYGSIALIALVLLSLKRRTFFLSIGVTVAALVAMVLIFRETLSWTPPAAILALLALLIFLSMFGRSKRKRSGAGEEAEAA